MTSRLARLYALSLLIMVLVSCALTVSTAGARATVERLTIVGRVVSSDGTPLSGIVVFAFDRISVVANTTTDADGRFRLALPAGRKYIIYFIDVPPNGTLPRFIPAKLTIAQPDAREAEVEVTLIPAAYAVVRGRAYYIGGSWTGSFKVRVLLPDGSPLSEGMSCGRAVVKRAFAEPVELSVVPVDEYGDSEDVMLAFTDAIRHRVIPRGLIRRDVVLLPEGKPIVLQVLLRVVEERGLIRRVRWFVIPLGSRESPLLISRGAPFTIDLDRESVRQLVLMVRDLLRRADEIMSTYERLGFYLGAEREEYGRLAKMVDEAERICLEGGDLTHALELLERAYVFAIQAPGGVLYERLKFMESVAMEGAMILPAFLAIFAMAIAMYFHEQTRRKLATYIITYALFVLLFYFVYPGAPLLWSTNRRLFMLSVAVSFAVPSLLIFVLPRYIREQELPGKLRRGSLIAITFSLAKRYSRLRKFRTLITIFSIAALIWAVTVFASVSKVYGIKMEAVKVEKPGFVGLVVRHLVGGTPSMLSVESDYMWFAEQREVTLVVPRAMTLPGARVLIEVSRDGRRVLLHAALGVSPEESELGILNDALIAGSLSKLNADGPCVILPYTVSVRLRAKVGDVVNVTFTAPGVAEVTKVTMKVVGIFSEDRLQGLKDPDGMSVLPWVAVDSKFVPANASDIIIVGWRFLITKVLPYPLTGVSRVAGVHVLLVKVKDPAMLKDLARRYIERKGSYYYAYVFEPKRAYVIYFGQKVETIFGKSLAFMVPLLIVISNVMITMYSIIYERRREIYLLFALGLNPAQIAFLFLAESMIYGLLGGCIGYLSGLATFRLMTVCAALQSLVVKEKLEWYWSVIAVVIAILTSMAAAFKPALKAAYLYTPSLIKRIKAPEEVRERREEMITRLTTEKTYGVNIRIREAEAPIFFDYLQSRLKDFAAGYRERVENIQDLGETREPSGKVVRRIKFSYILLAEGGRELPIRCEIIGTKLPRADYFVVELKARPAKGVEVPVKVLDRVATLFHDIVKSWERERRLLGLG